VEFIACVLQAYPPLLAYLLGIAPSLVETMASVPESIAVGSKALEANSTSFLVVFDCLTFRS